MGDILTSEFPPASLPTGREFPVHSGEDAHLRSLSDVDGYEVWSHYSTIGRLESFVVDESSWHLRFLDVKMGDWLHRRSMLVPTSYVSAIFVGPPPHQSAAGKPLGDSLTGPRGIIVVQSSSFNHRRSITFVQSALASGTSTTCSEMNQT